MSAFTAIEASRHLRITPELLYQYVRHGAKGRDGRRLACVPGSAAKLFAREELDEYDRWLAEPWADAGAPRRDPPQGVRDYLKVEAGGVCPLCGAPGPLEDAHIDPWSASRSNHHHNLLRMCGPCHTRYDGGLIPREEVEARKEDAIGRVQALLRRRAGPEWPIPGAPPVASSFLGREQELGLAIDALRSGRSLVVEGVGGIGKTQLVLNALRAAAADRAVLWLGIDTMGDTGSIKTTLASLARNSGIEVRDGRPRLEDAGPCLVLDGIERLGEDQDDVVDLLQELLANSVNTLVVATTQVTLASLEFAETVRLGPLDEAAAMGILTGGASTTGSTALADFAEGHPLTLRLLRVLLRHYGNAATVMAELSRRGAAAVADPQRTRQSARTSLTACLELAYSRLSEGERRLLWTASVSPGDLRPGLHGMAGTDIPPSEVAALRAWNLVDQYPDEEFDPDTPPRDVLHVLSPIRSFVQHAIATDGTVDWADATLSFCRSQALLTSYIQNGMIRGPAPNVGRSLMERELPNAVSAFGLAVARVDAERAFLPLLISLGHSTMMTLFTSGAFATGADVMRRAADAAARNGAVVDALQFLFQMQTLSERQHDERGASAALAEAERIAADAGGEVGAMLLLMRASAAERAGDHARAAELARRSYDLACAGGERAGDTRRSAAFILGRALEFDGRSAEALPFYQETIEYAERENDPINRGSILHHIGNCEAYAGRYQAAMHAYRKAGEQFVELEAFEFMSNAIGEAGLVLPMLDPLVGLPGKVTVEFALHDVIDQFEVLLSAEMYGGRNPRVTMRKLIGILCLALHNRQETLLPVAAEHMFDRFVAPMFNEKEPPDWVKMLLYNIQWTIRLFQFLAWTSQQGSGRQLTEAELTLLGWLSSRAFVSLDEIAAPAMASYLRRRRGMEAITAPGFLALMSTEGDEAVLRKLADDDGIDLGWLS